MSNLNLNPIRPVDQLTSPDQIEVIAEVCLEVNELVQAHGTDTMKMLMRVLLLEIGQEIARQGDHALGQPIDE